MLLLGSSSTTCTNIVTRVHTAIFITSPGAISATKIYFVLADRGARGGAGAEKAGRAAGPSLISQQHSIQFLRAPVPGSAAARVAADIASGGLSNAVVTNMYPRSGNPGYIRGKPVLAGLVTTLVDGVSYVAMSDRADEWLWVPKSGEHPYQATADPLVPPPTDPVAYGSVRPPVCAQPSAGVVLLAVCSQSVRSLFAVVRSCLFF